VACGSWGVVLGVWFGGVGVCGVLGVGLVVLGFLCGLFFGLVVLGGLVKIPDSICSCIRGFWWGVVGRMHEQMLS
jgi:hypothetical protein